MLCPQAKEHRSPQKLAEVRKDLPQSQWRGWGPANTLILDFRSSELGEKFWLFSPPTRLVKLRYSHLGRPMQVMRRPHHLDRRKQADRLSPPLQRPQRGMAGLGRLPRSAASVETRWPGSQARAAGNSNSLTSFHTTSALPSREKACSLTCEQQNTS